MYLPHRLPSAARPATGAHPARHLLGQAHLLLRAAHATQIGASRRGWPPGLDQTARARLALAFVTITTLAELHVFPDNLLPGVQQPDTHLARRMDHAQVRLRQARTNLETLAWAGPGARHSVLTVAAEAAHAMDAAWILTQQTGGYHNRRQVDRTCAQLGHILGSVVDLATGEQQHDRRWTPTVGLLSTATHALHHIHTPAGGRP